MPQSTDSQRALDTVDRFVDVAGEIAELPILREPEFRAAADALYRIAEHRNDNGGFSREYTMEAAPHVRGMAGLSPAAWQARCPTATGGDTAASPEA